MDYFSGLPMFQKMNAGDVTAQLKNWFGPFRVARLIQAYNGPPYASKECKFF